MLKSMKRTWTAEKRLFLLKTGHYCWISGILRLWAFHSTIAGPWALRRSRVQLNWPVGRGRPRPNLPGTSSPRILHQNKRFLAHFLAKKASKTNINCLFERTPSTEIGNLDEVYFPLWHFKIFCQIKVIQTQRQQPHFAFSIQLRYDILRPFSHFSKVSAVIVYSAS